jgi:hypothetical protein
MVRIDNAPVSEIEHDLPLPEEIDAQNPAGAGDIQYLPESVRQEASSGINLSASDGDGEAVHLRLKSPQHGIEIVDYADRRARGSAFGVRM